MFDHEGPEALTDLRITKTDGSLTYTPGSPISYTIVVTNIGPSNATGSSVIDDLPLTITSVSASCMATGATSCGTNASVGNYVWLTDLNIVAGTANYLTITVSGTVSAAAQGDLINTAEAHVGVGQIDLHPDDNTATDHSAPAPVADLAK